MIQEHTRIEYDCSSGVEKIVALTQDEVDAFNKQILENNILMEKQQAILKEKEEAKKTALQKLKSLGLTEAEIESIFSI
jgi:ABC-type polar amino acid transport system ATPase subunit